MRMVLVSAIVLSSMASVTSCGESHTGISSSRELQHTIVEEASPDTPEKDGNSSGTTQAPVKPRLDGAPLPAEVVFEIAGTPNVGENMTATASFSLPTTSYFITSQGGAPADVVVGISLGKWFNVTSTNPPCDVCSMEVDGSSARWYEWELEASPGVTNTIAVNMTPLITTSHVTGLLFSVSDAYDAQYSSLTTRGVRVGDTQYPGEIE